MRRPVWDSLAVTALGLALAVLSFAASASTRSLRAEEPPGAASPVSEPGATQSNPLASQDRHDLDEARDLSSRVARLQQEGKFFEGLEAAVQALAVRERLLGEKHLDTAASHFALGSLQREMRGFTAAQPHLEKALKIRTLVLGEQHAETYYARRLLGFDLFDQGKCAAGRPYYEQTLTLARELFGETHASTAEAL